MTNQEIKQKVDYFSRQLRLPTFRQSYEELAQKAAQNQLNHEHYLHQLMALEYDSRIEKRKKQRIRTAKFPYKKYLQGLIVKHLPIDAQQKLPLLQRLDFIKNGHNLILAGNPGTGKTHLAIALGIKACLEDFSVLFTTIPRLITKINESRSARTLGLLESRFEKYDLVICDEFGYISFDKSAAELLFTHLSLRAGRKSTIITTNLGFDRWIEIFGDEVLTAALVDRLTHKAAIINMNGQSFRQLINP